MVCKVLNIRENAFLHVLLVKDSLASPKMRIECVLHFTTPQNLFFATVSKYIRCQQKQTIPRMCIIFSNIRNSEFDLAIMFLCRITYSLIEFVNTKYALIEKNIFNKK